VIEPGTVPRLVPAARLRFDRIAGRMLLLYPERGMVLNPTAAAIVELCTGEYRVSEMVELLLRETGGPRAQIERDVLAFLGELERRRLLLPSEPTQ
jgi:coenzyme PQQ biosynthesis protein PqqD